MLSKLAELEVEKFEKYKSLDLEFQLCIVVFWTAQIITVQKQKMGSLNLYFFYFLSQLAFWFEFGQALRVQY